MDKTLNDKTLFRQQTLDAKSFFVMPSRAIILSAKLYTSIGNMGSLDINKTGSRSTK